MDKKMVDRINKQLRFVEQGKLFCSHNAESACDDCRKKLTGNISGLTGDLTKIEGKAEDIKKILLERKQEEVRIL
jgi:hypothetical protein